MIFAPRLALCAANFRRRTRGERPRTPPIADRRGENRKHLPVFRRKEGDIRGNEGAMFASSRGGKRDERKTTGRGERVR